MNFNKHKKTVPLNAPNKMNANPTFQSSHTQAYNAPPNPNTYSQSMSPRNVNTTLTNSKSPRPKKKKSKKKLKMSKQQITSNSNDTSNSHRVRSHTTGNNIGNHNGNALYMTNTWGQPTNSPYDKPPPPPQHRNHNVYHSGTMGTAEHNATGTMIKHTVTHESRYNTRQDCVWPISLFQQPDSAAHFSCLTCCDVPRIPSAYTCDQERIYCEYCIDIKYRQNEIKQKKRMPLMVQNMINELKIKCPMYDRCKYRGNVRGVREHYKACVRNSRNSNKSNDCPLQRIGCVEFKGGYLREHYTECQEQHLNYILSFVEGRVRKFEGQLQQQTGMISALQKENEGLRSEIEGLKLSNNELRTQVISLLNHKSQNRQAQNSEYKIVVNNGEEQKNNNVSVVTDTTQRDTQWNSFVSAHRRLSTKTGATIPENEDINMNQYSDQLLRNPQSYTLNTANSSQQSYESSVHSVDTASEDDDAKQMELPISDQKMVVIDIGSQLSKVGLAGSNKPAVIFQSMVAKHKLNGSRAIGNLQMNGSNGKMDKLTNYQCSYPIDRGIIKSYDDYESIIHSIFYDKLQINPHEYNALLIEPILSSKKQSQKILEICFEKFNLNALFLAIDALCALYASGGNTGLSVSSGHGVTSVVPIYEGYVIPHAAQKLDYGGHDITHYLKDKLNLHGLFRSLLSENKFADSLKQKLSYVCNDYAMEKQHTMFERIVYRLPDGSEIEVGQERFECAESLFNKGNINGSITTIAELVNKSLSHASDDIRQVLFENIVCSGGNTMLKGFDDRLKVEVDNTAPDKSGWATRVFGLVDRKLSCWIGGSIMASLSHMDQLWITRKQYQDVGVNILNQQY